MTQSQVGALKAIRLAFKILSENLSFFVPVAFLCLLFGWFQIPIEAELQKQWDWLLVAQDSCLAVALTILSFSIIAGGGMATSGRGIQLQFLMRLFRSKTSWIVGYCAISLTVGLAGVFLTQPDGTVHWIDGEPNAASLTFVVMTIALSIYLILFQCPMLLEERTSLTQLLRTSGRFTAIYLFRFFVLGFLICLPYVPLGLFQIFVTKGLHNPVTYVISHWPLPLPILLLLGFCSIASMLVATLFQIALVVLYRDFQSKYGGTTKRHTRA